MIVEKSAVNVKELTKNVPAKRPIKQKKYGGTALTGWLFVIPATLLITLFVFYPMLQSFILSQKTGAGTNLQWNWWTNYTRMFSDTLFYKSIINTFIYLIVQVPVMIVLAMFIAVLLNGKKLVGKSFFRTAIFLPCVTSLVSYSLIMKSIFADNGIMNKFLGWFSVRPIHWFTDSFWSRVLIIISITWRWTGYNMIFFLSGLQNIDPSIYEAAELDGAGPVRTFFSITAPQLKPIILFVAITSTIGTLQLFDEVQNITQGGPANGTMTISQYIYNTCFKYTPNFGYASAMSFVVMVFIILLSAVQFAIGGDKKDAVKD